MLAKYSDQVREGSVCPPNLISTSLYPPGGGGGGHSPSIWVGVCSCGSETPTLNKGFGEK